MTPGRCEAAPRPIRQQYALGVRARSGERVARRPYAHRVMFERRTRFDFAFGAITLSRFNLLGFGAGILERAGSSRKLLLRLTERRGDFRKLGCGHAQSLLKLGAFAGQIGEPATNHGALAHYLGEQVFEFLESSLAIFERMFGAGVLPAQSIKSCFACAPIRDRLARKPGPGFGACGARCGRLVVKLAQLPLESRLEFAD